MALTYVMSDIHGDYDRYLKILEKIHFTDTDTLYILGDVVDRGEQSMKVLFDMMLRPNVIPVLGNHEYMAIHCLRFLMQEITEESIDTLDEGIVHGIFEWQNVGGQSTIDEFHRLSTAEQQDILDYLEEFSLYEEVAVNGKTFVLVHASLDNFSPNRPLEDYELHELIFGRPEYYFTYYPHKYLVTGHTPTRLIEDNPHPDRIYRANNHIAIDCGCGYGGQLGALCLETGDEFYSDEQ